MSKLNSLVAEIKAIQDLARRTGRIGLAKSLDQILVQCERDADREDKQLSMRPVVSTQTGNTPILTWIEQEEEFQQTTSTVEMASKD
ncbi:MAG: hypothetical protein ABJQ34_17505 [Paracoccaceae bacterium]